mmetsp:Transcript_3486/g.6724  ORF Transcript_3486/g.6724 Transcript_3486/m.6724 type:complete len:120 (+) Transcript_3486:3010-3369(+)
MMFSAMLRSVLPPLRSFSPRSSSLGGFLKSSMGIRNESPLSLMGGANGIGALREKACLSKNKSASKRFIVRGKGRIRRGKGGRSHNTGHKGRKRINNLAASTGIKEKAIEQRMRVLIRA